MMEQFKVVICALLAVFVQNACCQPDKPEILGPGDFVELPERRLPCPFPFPRPMPVPKPPSCQPKTSGWSWKPVDAPPAPSNTYYWGCKVRKPDDSKCIGGCNSSASINVDRGYSSALKNCQCCQVKSIRKSEAYPYCLVLKINNGNVSYKWQYVTGSNIKKHVYYRIDRCECSRCSWFGFPWVRPELNGRGTAGQTGETEPEEITEQAPTDIIPPQENVDISTIAAGFVGVRPTSVRRA